MFIKQFKYDFFFAARAFFGMGIGILAIGLASGLIGRVQGGFYFATTNQGFQVLSWVLMITVIIGGIQLFHLYNRQYFKNYGHLMMTLPVGRGVQLVSKYIAALVWVGFLIGVLTVSIRLLPLRFYDHLGEWTLIAPETIPFRHVNTLGLFIKMALFWFLFIAFLFFAATLKHSVIKGRRVHFFRL